MLAAAAAGPARIRRAAPIVALASASLVISLFGAELFVRSDWANTHLVGGAGSYRYFPARLRPQFNALGYRDVDHARAKPPDVVRIVVVGDSLTFGRGVASDEIWPHWLQQFAGPGVEVIAIARDGWSTEDERRAFVRDGRPFAPDFVVVGVVDNDLQPPSEEPPGQQAEWKIFGSLGERLEPFAWLDYALNRIGDRLGWRYRYEEWVADTFDPSGPYLANWKQSVAEFGDELRGDRIPGYAFVLTLPVQPDSEAVIAHHGALQREFAANGFVSVDLQPAFLAEFGPDGDRTLWALPNDPHPGPRVQHFIAREIWRELEPAVRAR
jgi:hypothetical protein